VQHAVRRQSFDGRDLLADGFAEQHAAGLRGNAIDVEGTGAAWAMPQPVPVSPTFSRIAHSNGVSTSISNAFPLIARLGIWSSLTSEIRGGGGGIRLIPLWKGGG
jgi:hypothetical protein